LRPLVVATFLVLLAGAPAAGQPNDTLSAPTIGGLIQVQADAGDRGDSRFSSDNERFYLRRARLSATGRLPRGFDYRLELDLAGTLAETAGLRAQLTDGYIHWNRRPAFQVRAGQFKTPFGFEQLYPDPRLLTIERTLANDRLTLGRQVGAEARGELGQKRFGWAAGLFNGAGTNTTANDGSTFLAVGRVTANLFLGPVDGFDLSAGGAVYSSRDRALSGLVDFGFDLIPETAPDPDNAFRGRRRGFNGDLELKAGRYVVWLEYLHARFEPDNEIPADELEAAGGSALGGVMLVPARLQLLGRYEFFDASRDVSGNAVETGMIGFNYFVTTEVKLQVNQTATWLPGEDDPEYKTLGRLQAAF
jgi:phosphate-selective porin OprO and OprP